MTQATLWQSPSATERARLSRQCQTILERLERGPVTNTELVTIACQYNARILELRRAGYAILKTSQNHETGVSTYALEVRQ